MTKFWSPDGRTYYNVAHIISIKLRHDLKGGRHLQIALSDSRVQEIDLLDDDVVAEVIQEIIIGTVSAK